MESEQVTSLSDNPLLAQLVFVKMEEAMDKLKLLDYEAEFCAALKFRPFPRHYFAIPTNSGEQFYAFTNLATWLINVCGKKLEQPQEYDDPNATISTIISEAKKLGASTKFAPAKLKSGSGEQVCSILSDLADQAMLVKRFTWKKPVHADEESHEEVLAEQSDVELGTAQRDEIQEEMIDSDEEGPVFLDLALARSSKDEPAVEGLDLDRVVDVNMDPEQWRQEVERVLPSLRIAIRHDHRDWRVHYEQMHHYHDGISSFLVETKEYLDKLHREIAKTLEKIGSREKYINNQLDRQVELFRTAQNELAEAREKYKEGSSSVNELARELAQTTAELESVKAEMDERGTNMTDAGPVVRIRRALNKLKQECSDMEVQIGIIEHGLLEAKMKNKTSMKTQMIATTSRQSNTMF